MPSKRLSTIYAAIWAAVFITVVFVFQFNNPCLTIFLVGGVALFGINAYVKWDRDARLQQFAPPPTALPPASPFGTAAPNSRQLRVPGPHPDDHGS